MSGLLTSFEHWMCIWYALGGRPGSHALYEQLRASYAEPHRVYHTLDHVEHCLQLLEAFRHLAIRPAEVALALWFHDAIYDPHATDNEDRSAEWAVAAVHNHDVGTDAIDRVRAMILATQHTGRSVADDPGLVIDIDLAILGQSAEAFDRYDRQIREEYRWVSDPSYRVARTQVLQSFLDRNTVYAWPAIRDRFERPARRNIRRALDRLSDPRSPEQLIGR